MSQGPTYAVLSDMHRDMCVAGEQAAEIDQLKSAMSVLREYWLLGSKCWLGTSFADAEKINAAFAAAKSGQAIFVRIATVYGTITLYPVCDKAKAFCSIAGTKTITPAMMREINAIGFEVYEDPTTIAQRKIKMGVDA